MEENGVHSPDVNVGPREPEEKVTFENLHSENVVEDVGYFRIGECFLFLRPTVGSDHACRL